MSEDVKSQLTIVLTTGVLAGYESDSLRGAQSVGTLQVVFCPADSLDKESDIIARLAAISAFERAIEVVTRDLRTKFGIETKRPTDDSEQTVMPKASA